jgi:hypothetical protein
MLAAFLPQSVELDEDNKRICNFVDVSRGYRREGVRNIQNGIQLKMPSATELCCRGSEMQM